jgi:fatty-acyl-CoA synthase
VLQVLPQYHVGGWNVQPLQALMKGATLVLEADFDPARCLELIERRGITTTMGVPATYLMLAEEPAFERTDVSSLRTAIVGGAPMPVALLSRWQRRGVAIAQGYGLTEASPNVLCLEPCDAATRLGSAGTPYPFVEVELRDPASGARIEGPGSGEIHVRGPNVFSGYFCDEAATASALRPGGWLATGDIAERDADGCYVVRGRGSEMYISGGENVYPAEVENALAAHAGVVEAAVIGIPDDRWGERGRAYVVPRPGLEPSAAELLAHCRDRLAGFKVPREICFVTELPRTSTGKLDRRRLRTESEGGAALRS